MQIQNTIERAAIRALLTVQGPFNGEWRVQFKGHTVTFASDREEALDKATDDLYRAGVFPFNTGGEAIELLVRLDRRQQVP